MDSHATGREPVLSIDGLGLRYPNGKQALADVSLTASRGELVVVLGSNGSGKSSMLRCVVRLAEASTGTVTVADQNMTQLTGNALRVARQQIGMVGQTANLVRRRSVLANVAAGTLARHRDLGTLLGRVPAAETHHAHSCLAEVGLGHLARQRAGTLSGGQAQRVSIARALAQRPQLVLADEPVASLDPEAAHEIMRLLRRLADEGLAVVCVLHQPELATRYGDRVVGLRDGRTAFSSVNDKIRPEDIEKLYTQNAA